MSRLPQAEHASLVRASTTSRSGGSLGLVAISMERWPHSLQAATSARPDRRRSMIVSADMIASLVTTRLKHRVSAECQRKASLLCDRHEMFEKKRASDFAPEKPAFELFEQADVCRTLERLTLGGTKLLGRSQMLGVVTMLAANHG